MGFLVRVIDQTYTTKEWEYFALNQYRDEQLEAVRSEMVDIIKISQTRDLQDPYTEEMKLSIHRLISDLEDMRL